MRLLSTGSYGPKGILIFGILTLMLQGCSLSPISWNMWGPINESSGVAVSGYDVVAFRSDGAATEGSEEFNFLWKDVEWHFASQENRDLFSGNPVYYAPEYGGYCAYSVSKGITFYGDPEYWVLENDRLFFFFNDYTRTKFKDGIGDGIIERADANWTDNFPDVP